MQIAGVVRGEVEEIFDCIDEDRDRSISFQEYAELILEMDHSKSEVELRAAFGTIDRDGDGRVSFEDFYAWVTR